MIKKQRRRWIILHTLCVVFFVLLNSPCFATTGSKAEHPLDSLNASEIQTATESFQADPRFPKKGLFPLIYLKEPQKSEILNYKHGQAFERIAAATIFEPSKNETVEATMNLSTKKVLTWKKVPGVQPLFMETEYGLLAQIVKSDPRWQEAVRKRGITDFEKVWVDAWGTTHFFPAKYKNTRLLRGISFYRDGGHNYYGRPIEGLSIIVDMNTKKIVEFKDYGAVPITPDSQDFDVKTIGKPREGLRPLKVVMPEGPSFSIKGNSLEWQNWNLRYSFHPRDGLVLHQIQYNDQGKLRPIIYRASISEMMVPYGDPHPDWAWRNAFDEGEYGLGKLTVSLIPHLDAPSNAVFLSETIADDHGRANLIKNAIAVYERDGGILWKHQDMYTQMNESRRSRELVILTGVSIGNYDYFVEWIFKQDGSITVDLALTGIMLAKGIPYDGTTSHEHHSDVHEHVVSRFVSCPHHQHFFSFRFDFNIDGEKNSVAEINTRSMPAGPKNPFGNGILMEEKLLKTTSAATRDLNLNTARKWKVFNPHVKNKLGMESGYVLLPGDNSVPYLAKNTLSSKLADFINHHFWVTPFRENELYAAGEYPNQSNVPDGLGKWAKRNESIVDRDLVVWYTIGIMHVPRVEEWPVMPVTRIKFDLVPAGFFNRNPSLDVPLLF